MRSTSIAGGRRASAFHPREIGRSSRALTLHRPPSCLHVPGDAARVAAAVLRWRPAAAARAAARARTAARSPPPSPHPPGASHVAPPKRPLRRTRHLRFPVSCVARSSCAGAAPPNGVLGGLVPSRSHGPPPCPAGNFDPRECPRAARARRLAPSALASLRAASVRFTPSRAPSLSPRRAPLLAGASPTHTPAPADPLLHRAPARAAAPVCVDMAAHHSVGAARGESRRVVDGVKASATQPP